MAGFRIVDASDPRFNTLKKGFNLRWPDNNRQADAVYLCATAQGVLDAANDALAKGHRITVRSGGHCYEGFVNNKLAEDGDKTLAVIDLSEVKGLSYDAAGNISSPYDESQKYAFSAFTGNQNWDGYNALYKSANCTVPGGSCYSVGSGGHVLGGGYGLLSRLHGLTVDWLSGVDILVPNPQGTSLVAKHVSLASEGADRELFIACRGGGGGNFGIVLTYYYKALPPAPKEVYLLTLTYPWAGFASQDQFSHFMKAYWQWFADHDAEWNSSDPAKANGGLFTLLKVQHRATGDINLVIQYTGANGDVGGAQDAPFIDFVNTMNAAAGFAPVVSAEVTPHGPQRRSAVSETAFQGPVTSARKMEWLYATQTLNGSGDNLRGKYKSVYQKGQFGQQELNTLWNSLNDLNEKRLSRMLVQFDSYGGCINTNDEAANPTAVYQRRSLIKAQFQSYWASEEEDAFQLAWMKRFYQDYFADYGGKPYESETYEGCYINYPDLDMKYLYAEPARVDPRWLALYYGDKVSRLHDTKLAVDGQDLFHNALSIPLVLPE